MALPRVGGRVALVAKAVAPVIGAIAAQAFVHYQNKAIMTTEYEIRSKGVTGALDGFRIVQVSDLHDAEFGFQNENLVEAVKRANPDLIAITGDFVHNDTLDNAMAFARHAVSIAPVAYIPGNHEPASPRYPELRTKLMSAGVTVLEDAVVTDRMLGLGAPAGRGLLRSPRISVIGLADQLFSPWVDRASPETLMERKLDALLPKAEGMEQAESGAGTSRRPFRILLAHRPEFFASYARDGIDLVLAGHAHGGQWRVPVLGGLYAPSQGLFPKYASGVHTEGTTTMVVSRGLGNSGFPLRLNNRPEVVVVTLRPEGVESDLMDALSHARERLVVPVPSGKPKKVPKAEKLVDGDIVRETAKAAVISKAPAIVQQVIGAVATVAISAVLGKSVL